MVKYAPRKVYIRESGGYVELSYTEFCRCRESDQTYMDKLFIPIQGCLLEVVREQYTDFYRDKERWRYLQKLDTKNRLLSLDGFTDSEGNPLDFITDEAVDIAETVVNAVMVDRLKAALPLLSDSEQELIQAIFFDGLSEREVGARLGITQSVVNKRKARILIKLRKIIENSNFRSHRTHRLYHEIYNFSTCFFTYAVCCVALTSFSINLFILSFMVSLASSLKCTLTTYIVPPICFLSATGVCDFLLSIFCSPFFVLPDKEEPLSADNRKLTTDLQKLSIPFIYSYFS